jgi:hypothetical protein
MALADRHQLSRAPGLTEGPTHSYGPHSDGASDVCSSSVSTLVNTHRWLEDGIATCAVELVV